MSATDISTAPAPVRASDEPDWTHHLLLPGIRCAGCIRGVEGALNALPGVDDARVNLTRKRVSIRGKRGTDPCPYIDALEKAGYEAHEIDAPEKPVRNDLILPLGVSGFAMMNVMLISVAVWSGAADSTRDFLHWVAAAIALPATAYAAQPFFGSAWSALRAGRLNMDVPISLAILLACGMSVYEVSQGGEDAWFDAALALTFFLLIGRVLDQRLRRATRSAADDLTALEPSRVECVAADGSRVSKPVAEVTVGERLHLTAGARVPVDAVLGDSPALIDRSALTGESDPERIAEGGMLLAGDVMISGPVMAEARAVGEDTTLRRMAELVSVAENGRNRYRSLADQAAAIYTPAVHIISAAASAGWLIATGDVRTAMNVAIATLIITCPCALGLAVPAVAVASAARLFRKGLLVKSETALERLASVDTVIFDKTGTLTRRAIVLPEDLSSDETSVLKALADASDHPLCRDLRKQLGGVGPASLSDVEETAGRGVRAFFNGAEAWLGQSSDPAAGTILSVGDRSFILQSTETLLPGAADVVAQLKSQGLTVGLLTGDRPEAANKAAMALGVEKVWSGVRPEEKADLIAHLQDEGRAVLMVGDGLNDTAALARAHASIAPGSALEASRNAADVVMVTGDIAGVPEALAAGHWMRRRSLQNFGIAAAYNSIAMPLAVAGLASPLLAAVAMSTSSLTVILNTLRGSRT